MARLSDLSAGTRAAVTGLDCPQFDEVPWVTPPPPSERVVTLISSAGIHGRHEPPFAGADAAGYRALPESTADIDLVMSHVSVNFDRSAFLMNPASILPRQLLAQMQTEGVIGRAADEHYSFMGATDPVAMEPQARALAAQLRARGVNTAVLLPV